MALGALVAPAGVLAAQTTAPADTSTPCNLPTSTQLFAGFGDLNYYYPAPGGSFETMQWGTSGKVSLVPETAPLGLGAAGDAQSVRLPARTSITSPDFCVSQAMPHLRFAARSYGSGPLAVRVDLYQKGVLKTSATTQLAAGDYVSWAPTADVTLDTSTLSAGEKALARVTMTSQTSGDWQVDDVYVDPYAR